MTLTIKINNESFELIKGTRGDYLHVKRIIRNERVIRGLTKLEEDYPQQQVKRICFSKGNVRFVFGHNHYAQRDLYNVDILNPTDDVIFKRIK